MCLSSLECAVEALRCVRHLEQLDLATPHVQIGHVRIDLFQRIHEYRERNQHVADHAAYLMFMADDEVACLNTISAVDIDVLPAVGTLVSHAQVIGLRVITPIESPDHVERHHRYHRGRASGRSCCHVAPRSMFTVYRMLYYKNGRDAICLRLSFFWVQWSLYSGVAKRWSEKVRGTFARLIEGFYEQSEVKNPMSVQLL